MLAIANSDDEDDGPGGGLMQRAYNPWQVVDLNNTTEYD